MNRTTTAAVLTGTVLLLAACGDSSSSEQAIEEILEEATGQDAEIDLSDGEIRVQTEEGEVEINIDEEDGSFEMSVDGFSDLSAQFGSGWIGWSAVPVLSISGRLILDGEEVSLENARGV